MRNSSLVESVCAEDLTGQTQSFWPELYASICCSVVSYIFVHFNIRGLAETEMFVDIWIHCFDTCKWLLLLMMPFVVNEISWFDWTNEKDENYFWIVIKKIKFCYISCTLSIILILNVIQDFHRGYRFIFSVSFLYPLNLYALLNPNNNYILLECFY